MSRIYGVNRVISGAYEKGIKVGIKLMEERLQLACENGSPINIEGKAFFVKSDMENLRDIFEDLKNK